MMLFGVLVIVPVFAGCRSTESANYGGVEVTIAGDGEFPDALAGKWKADKGGWEFVFESDGQISAAVISTGRVEIIPGKATRYPTRFGGKGVFEPGLWTVQYNPAGRELAITVVIDYFRQDLWPGQAMEGAITDIISGPISEDYDEWEADWFGFGRLTAYIPEPNEFYNTSEPEFRDTLIFEKVKDSSD